MSTDDKKNEHGHGTTGHSWDGIEEWNNPLPRWWVWTFYVTIAWGLIYTILYPAWPLVDRATQGLWGGSTRAEVAADIASFEAANAEINAKLAAADLTTVSADADLQGYAFNAGAAVFRTWCAQCHGSGAAGAKGYPNLLDNDWLWGGDVEAVHQTIAYGIRSDHDDTRYSEMPAFGEWMAAEEIAALTQHVLAVSGQENDAALAATGATLFADNCSSCHGDTAMGDREQGAPNLTDAIWLFGGDEASITETITNSRFGVMPSWSNRLSEAEVSAVAVYVHSLGGGE
jgi:cytochrome c oxidase cbb3-type subunit 3